MKPWWRLVVAFGLTIGAQWMVFAGETLRVESNGVPVEWTVAHGDKKLLVVRSDPRQFKSYVKELCTLRGENLLRDAPEDHLHHHALMYAIRVNGINFWEEVSGSGVQKTITFAAPDIGTNAAGRPLATLRQTLHWLAPQDAFLPDTPQLALLIEHRTLVLTVDPAQDEVALQWDSQFEVGAKTNTVILSGSTYFGLGARFASELDALADQFNSDGRPDLTGTRQDVSPHDWSAVAFNRPAAPATFVLFSYPSNVRGNAHFFAMKRPFAYLSATQGLDQEPLIYHTGDKFRLDYLVTVYPTVKSAEALKARATVWRNGKP